jgi:hypothetical protein
MSATRKMSREVFLRISKEIFQKFNTFRDRIPTFGSVYQVEIQRRQLPSSLQTLERLWCQTPKINVILI